MAPHLRGALDRRLQALAQRDPRLADLHTQLLDQSQQTLERMVAVLAARDQKRGSGPAAGDASRES